MAARWHWKEVHAELVEFGNDAWMGTDSWHQLGPENSARIDQVAKRHDTSKIKMTISPMVHIVVHLETIAPQGLVFCRPTCPGLRYLLKWVDPAEVPKTMPPASQKKSALVPEKFSKALAMKTMKKDTASVQALVMKTMQKSASSKTNMKKPASLLKTMKKQASSKKSMKKPSSPLKSMKKQASSKKSK